MKFTLIILALINHNSLKTLHQHIKQSLVTFFLALRQHILQHLFHTRVLIHLLIFTQPAVVHERLFILWCLLTPFFITKLCFNLMESLSEHVPEIDEMILNHQLLYYLRQVMILICDLICLRLSDLRQLGHWLEVRVLLIDNLVSFLEHELILGTIFVLFLLLTLLVFIFMIYAIC